MIKTQHLLHAVALYKHGHFSRAAKHVNISQPAFSRSIQNLENQLGVTLFERNGHLIAPTSYGETFLRRATGIIEQSVELEREIQLMQGLEIGRFGIAMGIYPAELSGNRAISDMILHHPDLRTEIILSSWRNVTRRVVSRSVDLGFAEISAVQNDEGLQTQLVGQHDLVLYCRGEHPLASRKEISKTVLDQYPLATIRLPKRMAKFFPGKGDIDAATGHLIPSVEVADLNTVRSIITGSNAIGAATPLQIQEQLSTGEFCVLPFWEPWLKLNYGFIFHRDRMRSPAAELFIETITRIEKEIGPQNEKLISTVFSKIGFEKEHT